MLRAPGCRGGGSRRECRAVVAQARFEPSESALQDLGDAPAEHGRYACPRFAGGRPCSAGAEGRHDHDERDGGGGERGHGDRHRLAISARETDRSYAN
jgi:hypothetical protein